MEVKGGVCHFSDFRDIKQVYGSSLTECMQ